MVVAGLFGDVLSHQPARGLEIQHKNLRLQQRGLHPLAFARNLALQQCGENAGGAEQSRGEVRHGNADPHRALVRRAGDRHQPAHALRDLIEAGTLVVEAVLAEAGNAAIDDARIDFANAVVIDAELGRDLPKYWVTLLRSSFIGCWLGITPGGAIAASFMGYNLAKRFSKDPESFGKGRIEGVFAPETAAHASGTAALLPMLALGIPGSGTAAILLGGLMVWGLNPGPLLFVEHKDFVWGLIASMYLGNVVGLVLVLTTVPIFASILRVPFATVAPMIVVSCAIGAYAIQNAMFDIWLMLGFGVVGYVFKKIGIPLAPFTLALVLGSRAEDAFRLSMIGAGGDMKVFWSNGLVGSITTLAIALLFWPVIDRAFSGIGRLLRPAKA